MSKIQIKPLIPKDPPEPKKTPRTSGAPPFTPAQPKPRQPASTPAAGAAQPQRQHAKTVRQARAATQAVPNERHSTAPQDRMREAPAPDLTGESNASMRSDSRNGMAFGECFAGFVETPDAISQGGAGAGAALEQLMETGALDEPLDCAALARLLPLGENDGIFDVILPSGDRLGVVVSGRSSSLSYLLSPSTDKFGSRLRRHRMELEERLERLTHRNVNITVL